MQYNFSQIKEQGLLLYEYIRGSQAYGLALPTSDIDKSGVFCMKNEDLLGLEDYKIDQINDESNDTSWYELGKFIQLLSVANPTALEALFIPEKYILYMHPAFKVIYDNRNMFITKMTFDSFCGYARSQISKARGLHKMIVKPVLTRKDILDFCYTFKDQGTQPFKQFLKENGLFAKYCGLVHLPNMEQMYGVYYDFGNHFKNENIKSIINCSPELIKCLHNYYHYDLILGGDLEYQINRFIKISQPIGYRGAIDEQNDTTQLRLSSIMKGEKPIAYISFNKDGFSNHCKQYKDYQEWTKKRNPQRFLENQGKEFDRKNMMHCTRLLNMGIEIAQTGQINIDRTNIDRDFLLNIRLGNATYEDLISNLDKKFELLKELIPNSTLPEKVDRNKVNKLLIQVRQNLNK